MSKVLATRFLSWGLVAPLLVLLGCGPLDQSARERAATVAALTQQADQWDKAIIRKDLRAIEGNMTSDFRQIRGSGDVINKEVFLRDITAPDLVIDPYSVEDFDVRLYGNVALLCGRTRMTGHSGGQPFTSHYRYIDTYVREDGHWRVCNVQITSLPK